MRGAAALREDLHAYARRLRRDQTDAEWRLWARLRDRQVLGMKFRRQHPIGPYIVDLCCTESRLIVELDGGHHARARDVDARRSAFLLKSGYRVLRFWNTDVLRNIEGVLECIGRNARHHPHPRPLPGRERE
ncbi:MAG: DUF559 domain-containing protein [Candidatus Rokubacteria bacterium]|nr:DUF559 domain-containing protein [Candidatus Rokubacteria bacterium]